MKSERHRDYMKNRHEQEDAHKRIDHNRQRGAKTFRRGRAITFLERMNLRRSTLRKQLETPELQSIHPILVGELKAVEMVIDEFVQLFELYEFEGETEADKNETPLSNSDDEKNE